MTISRNWMKSYINFPLESCLIQSAPQKDWREYCKFALTLFIYFLYPGFKINYFQFIQKSDNELKKFPAYSPLKDYNNLNRQRNRIKIFLSSYLLSFKVITSWILFLKRESTVIVKWQWKWNLSAIANPLCLLYTQALMLYNSPSNCKSFFLLIFFQFLEFF